MDIEELALPGVFLLRPKKNGDERGFFSETWNERVFSDAGLNFHFVQDNHSLSANAGVLRGLHYQRPPHSQDKLVRCSRGSILDIAVDIRQGSPTFGQHVSVVIDAENWQQIFVPKGFAHGFLTLEPNTEVQYKVTDFYAPDCDAGILWNDPALNIDWGVKSEEVILSAKDKIAPKLEEIDTGFVYSG